MTPLGRLMGIAVALVASLGIAWASSLPTTPNGSVGGVLRLAWTARPERVENCRTRSEDELSKIPAHMRQAVVCEGTTAAYRLEVRRDGVVVVDQIVRGGGWRHDRPLFVSRDIPTPSGDALIEVRMVRTDSPATSGAVQPSDVTPPSLRLERRLQFVPRHVILVTYDSERRELVTLEGS